MSSNNWEGSPEQAEFIKRQLDAVLDALIAAGMWTGNPPYQGKTAAEQVQMLAARADAAESALRLATHSTGSTTVLMTLEQYEELLAADKRTEAAERERDAWKQEADDERKSMRSAVRVMQERAEAAEAQLALVDAYGQYMRNAPKPRTFAEWLEWRESVRA